MIELTNTTKLFINRSFPDWHAPFTLEKSGSAGCPNGNCPWHNHMPENSDFDPHSISELLAIQPGTRLLVLADYCDNWHVSFMTLESIFAPEGSTQFRFSEKSRRCYYYEPFPHPHGGFGVHLFLASIRLIATVKSDTPAFGKFGKRPLFMRELSRITGLPMSEIRGGIEALDASIPKQELILKPWQSQATVMWNNLLQGEGEAVLQDLRHLLSFQSGHYPVAILFVVAAQHGKLAELKAVIGEESGVIPADFGSTIKSTISVLERCAEGGMKEEPEKWWPSLQDIFGINRHANAS